MISIPVCAPLRRSVLLAALAAAVPGAALGQSAAAVVQPGAPGMPSKVLPPETPGIVPKLSQADVEFMQGMIIHHSQAVEMTALIPSHTDDPDVRKIGAKISLSQQDEIRFMQRWLLARGQSTDMPMAGMPGMAMDAHPGPDSAPMPGMLTGRQMDKLRAANGAAFDRLFLSGMIQHHGGALTMVDALFAAPGAGQDAELFDFATDVDNTQRAEIKIMQHMLGEKE